MALAIPALLPVTDPIAGAVVPAVAGAGTGDFAGDLAKLLGAAPVVPTVDAPVDYPVMAEGAVAAAPAAGAVATEAVLAGLIGAEGVKAAAGALAKPAVALTEAGAETAVLPQGDAPVAAGEAGAGEGAEVPVAGAVDVPVSGDLAAPEDLAVEVGGPPVEDAVESAAQDVPFDAPVALPVVPFAPPVAEEARIEAEPEEEPAPEDPTKAEVTEAVGSALTQAVAVPVADVRQVAPLVARAVEVRIESAVALPVTGAAAVETKEAAPKAKASPREALPQGDAAQPAPVAAVTVQVQAGAQVGTQAAEVKRDAPDAAPVLPDDLTQAMQVQPQAVQAQPVEQKAAPVRTDLPGWEQVLADRIAADLADDGQEIELSLSPEKLGPLKIKLELADGQAQVKIITATPEAAKLFTETQHRLSEHLARAGLDLGGQSAESRQPRDDRPAPRGMRATEFMARAQRGEVEAAAPTRRAGAGLVNLMA